MTGISAVTCRGHLPRSKPRTSAIYCIKLVRSVPKNSWSAYSCIQSRAATAKELAAHVKGCTAACLAAAILLVNPVTSIAAEVGIHLVFNVLHTLCCTSILTSSMAVHMCLTMQLGAALTAGLYMQQHEKEQNVMCSKDSSLPLRHHVQA